MWLCLRRNMVFIPTLEVREVVGDVGLAAALLELALDLVPPRVQDGGEAEDAGGGAEGEGFDGRGGRGM